MDNGGVGPFLVNSFGDRYLYEVSGSAFDRIGSEALFKKHFGKDLFEENKLYVIVGSDSGLLPQYIANQGLPDGSYYIFIELPAVLDRLEEIIPEKGFHKKIIMTNAEEWLSRAKEIEFQNFVYLGNLKFISSFAAIDGRMIDYLDLTTCCQKDLEKIKWALNVELGTEIFHLRQLENLSENRVSAFCLQGIFKGKTAIILAGGPSLDEALSWVLEYRNCFVVIAVSRIARRLLEVNLTPDIIVSIDPTQLSFDISKEMLKLWDRTVFINKYHVVSTLLGQWCGRSLFLGPRVPWESSLNENILDAPGPTVTNAAIGLAVKMGVSQILLAGVDLCYSRDGYTHAQGSNERQVGPQLGKGLLWVETNGGVMAETTPDFHFAAKQIAAQAAAAEQNGCQILSLSEGATRISDVEYCSLSSIKLKELSQPALQILLEALPKEGIDEPNKYYQIALKELSRAQKAFREIKNLSDAAIKANDVFFGRRGHESGNRKHKVKMDRIEKKLKKDFTDFNLFVKRFGIRGFLKLLQGDQDRDWDKDDVERLGRLYYEAYRDSAGRLIEIVGKAAERLRVRLEEEKDQPDFKILVDQWRKDFQPGRSIVWKINHSLHTIPENYVDQFKTLEQEISETLLLKETEHLQRTRNWSQLSHVRVKLQVMYRQNQDENLCHLVNNLEELDGMEACSLACLGRGYLAELENNPEQALLEYQKLLDVREEEQDLSILEEALKRSFSLSLQKNDYENALVVAECLTGISITYLPYYADLLWLLDEKKTSLDLYADYLEQFPDDHAVMLKLGKHYLEIDLKDGARLMFGAILQQDSSNSAAKTLLDGMKKS